MGTMTVGVCSICPRADPGERSLLPLLPQVLSAALHS